MIVARKRISAPAKNAAPIKVNAASSRQTMARPASRKRIAWAKLTKWVEGDDLHHVLQRTRGMLSSGVFPPESRLMMMNSGMASRPNCGIERAMVARKMPMRGDREQVETGAEHEERDRAGDRDAEHASGRPASSDSSAATTMTKPLAQTFASMISVGASGMTSRCSTVPCSRSRIRAAPVSRMASKRDVVDHLHHGEEPAGVQVGVELGAQHQAHRSAPTRAAARRRRPHLAGDDRLDVAGAVAGLDHRGGVDVELDRRGCRPASRSAWKLGGMSRTKV